MYPEEFFGLILIVAVVVGFVWVVVWSVNDSEKSDKQMRQDYNNCVTAGKEWVFKYDTGLDGVCVTKK